MSGGVTMESVLGALTAHVAGAKTSLLDELTGPGMAAPAKDAKFEKQLGSELEADAVKAGTHTLGAAPPAVAGTPPKKAEKNEKSKPSVKDEDDKDADKPEEIAPDAQLLAMAQAMTAAMPVALPPTKLQAAMKEAMTAVSRGEQPAPTAPTPGKIDITGMTAVTPEESKKLMQDTRITPLAPSLSPTPAPSHPPAPPPSLSAHAPLAHVAALAQPAFTFTPPAARVTAHVTAPSVTVPAHATVTVSPAQPAQAQPAAQNQNQNDAPKDEHASDPHAQKQPLYASPPKASDKGAASTTPSDVTTTAADFMTAPTVSAPAAPVIMTNLVNVPTTVKPMTPADGAGARSIDASETAVKNAEAVGHKRVLASGDATGALNVEDLGRFEVRARSHEDGRVDVQVRAEHREGAAALDQHAAELRADVRVELPRANVQVQTAATDTGSGNAARERQKDAQERTEQGENRGGATRTSGVTKTSTPAVAPSTNRQNERVRIVL